MHSFEDISSDLKACMKPKRYAHTMGVADCATKLAKLYGADVKKARLAALLHDAAKSVQLTAHDMEEIAKRSIFVDSYPEDTKGEELFHAHAGEVIAREKYGVNDNDILSAIYYHTTGKVNMTVLEMIIYSADMIEPTRNFPGVDELRGYICDGLERLTLECMRHTVDYLIRSGYDVHRTTIEAYNYLKNKENGE